MDTVRLTDVMDDCLRDPARFLGPPPEMKLNGILAGSHCRCHWDIFMWQEAGHFVWSTRTRRGSTWWGSVAVEVDVPSRAYIEWAQQFADASRRKMPRLVFINQPGMCSYCGEVSEECLERTFLDPAGSRVRETCGSCEQSVSVERTPYAKRPRLLDVLYELYGGICQLCGRKIPRVYATIEHIIPKSLDNPELAADHIALHWGEDEASRVRELLPPIVESVLNYSLSCATCNMVKRATILEPGLLVPLLATAKGNQEPIQARLVRA